MAIRHNLAGQYGKSESTRRARWIIGSCVSVAGFTGFGVGLATGYFWSGYSIILGLAGAFGVLLLAFAAWRWLEPSLDRVARERIRHLRGGQAEALVAWLLEGLGDEWHIFNGVKLESKSDIDHILVGPAGVFCISTKSTRGLFTATKDGLLHNNKPSDAAQNALRQAMDIKDRLSALMGADVPWIQAVLAVPFGWIEGDARSACGGKVWVVHQENLTDELAGCAASRKVDQQQVTRTVEALTMLDRGAAKVYRRS